MDQLMCRCGHKAITHVNGTGRCTAYDPLINDDCPCSVVIPIRIGTSMMREKDKMLIDEGWSGSDRG